MRLLICGMLTALSLLSVAMSHGQPVAVAQPPTADVGAATLHAATQSLRAAEDAQRDARDEARKAQDAYNAADKRMSDFAAFGSWITAGFGVIAGLFGILITAVVVFFTFRTATTARSEARDAANEQLLSARTDIQTAVAKMTAAQTRVEATAATALDDIADKLKAIADAHVEADQHVAAIRAAAQAAGSFQPPGEGQAERAPAPPPVVEDRARLADAKPERQRSYDDWLALGLTAEADGRPDGALAAYTLATDLAPDPASRADAMFLVAATAWQRGGAEEALAWMERVLAMEPALHDLPIAKALFNKGLALGTLGRHNAAIAAYDDLLARFAADRAPALRELVAKALVNKGFRLGTLGRGDEEIVAYVDLHARFDTDPAPALREQVAKALLNKGTALGGLGRHAEATVAHDDLLSRFATDPAPALQEIVALVRAHRAGGAQNQNLTDGHSL